MSSILVLEDNQELQHYLCTVLRSAGHTVIGVSSNEKALEVVNHQKFDLFLLDVHLGEGSAFEFLEQIKHLSLETKICFVSSRRDSETVKKAVAAGAGDYIVKPVISGTLLSKVNKLLGTEIKEEVFSVAGCHFEAFICGSDLVQPDLIVTQVTEANVRIRSSAKLQVGALVPILVDDLQTLMEHDGDHLIFRVNSCEKTNWGKYQIYAEFVGLPEERLTKLRAFTIRGEYLPSKQDKKPA